MKEFMTQVLVLLTASVVTLLIMWLLQIHGVWP
jgi:hypothetical protein